MKKTEIVLIGMPKISLNDWYSGCHWSKRKKIKDLYKWKVREQTKQIFKDDRQYHVEYCFEFKSNPLDSSNCSAMVKIIEDILFKKDGYNVVLSVKMSSRKSKSDKVTITIHEINKDSIVIY